MVRNRWAWRIGVLVATAFLIPACGKGIKVAPDLFRDGFNGSFPGVLWTAPVLTGSATAQIDGSTGFPAPALKMTSTAPTSSARTETTTAFNNPNLTISVHLANLSSATTELGTGTISVLDATPAVVASASWNNATGILTLHINGGAADATPALAADGNFHRLVFNVSSGGLATWSLDGGVPAVSQASFPAGMLKVELRADFGTGTAWPSFFFDNVVATSP